MKKIGFILAVVLMVVCLGAVVPVHAAAAMQAEAKYATPTVDGVIRSYEYGNSFVLSAGNSSAWASYGPLQTSVTYRFAWSSEGLYIAFVYNPRLVGDQSLLQFVCNPGNQIAGQEQGLFFSVSPNHKVLLHNHRTQAGEATTTQAYDLSNQVTIASTINNGYKNTEVLLPIAAFRITNPDFTFTAGSMPASAVAMPYYQGEYTAGAAVTSNLEGWDLNTIGLGTLTLLPETTQNGGSDAGSGDYDENFGQDYWGDWWNDDFDYDYDDYKDPESDFDKNLNHGGRAIFYVAGILAIVFAGLGVLVTIFAITLLIILCVRKSKRKKGN